MGVVVSIFFITFIGVNQAYQLPITPFDLCIDELGQMVDKLKQEGTEEVEILCYYDFAIQI